MNSRDLIGHTLVQRYCLKEILQTGGMGSVFLAEDLRLKRQVAVKCLQSERYSENTPAELLQEARLLARVSHPNIVQIYDVIVVQGFCYLVMEYVDGRTLHEVQQEQVLSLRDKLDILLQVAAGIEMAHSKGIVHCDLKAANILIDKEYHAKVLDFGTSRLCHYTDDTAQSTTFLTPDAVAPEQLRQQPVDFRTDLFAFAVLACVLLQGRHPFGGTIEEQHRRILAGEWVLPNADQQVLAQYVNPLLTQLLQVEPNQRPSSCGYVIDVLNKALLSLKSTQQESAIPTQSISVAELSQPQRRFGWRVWGVALLLLALVPVLWLFLQRFWAQPSSRYVLQLPATIDAPTASQVHDQLLLQTGIDDAISQVIINTQDLQLVTPSAQELELLDVEALAKVTQATDVIAPVLSCLRNQCELRIERRTGPDWRVKEQIQWRIADDAYLENRLTIQANVAALYPDYSLSYLPVKPFAQKDYVHYLALYAAVKKQGQYTQDILQQLLKLVERSPYLYAAYSLLQEVVLDLYHQQKNPELLADFRAALQLAPAPYRQSVFYQLHHFYISLERQQLAQAEQLLESVQSQHLDPYLHAILTAELRLKQDNLESARESFAKALAMRRTHKALFNIATIDFQLGDYDNAISLLKEINDSQQQHYKARVLLANIYLTQGQAQAAIPLYERELAVQPQAETQNNLAIAYSLVNQWAKALAVVQKMDADAGNTVFLLNIADVYKANGYTEVAQGYYQRILQLTEQSDDFYSLLDRAQALAQLQQPAASLATLNRAIKLSPNSPEYAFTAALVNALSGESLSAMVQVEEALQNGYAPIWFNLPWFANLCSQTSFTQLVEALPNSVCGK